jgi:hypothetical protein
LSALDIFGVYVAAVRQHDLERRTTCDAQESVRVERADITRTDPAVHKGFGVHFRVLEVTPGHGRPTELELIALTNAYLDSWHRLADAAQSLGMPSVEHGSTAGLGQTVAFEDPNPQPLPCLSQLRVERCTSDPEEPQSPTQLPVDFEEEQAA